MGCTVSGHESGRLGSIALFRLEKCEQPVGYVILPDDPGCANHVWTIHVKSSLACLPANRSDWLESYCNMSKVTHSQLLIKMNGIE